MEDSQERFYVGLDDSAEHVSSGTPTSTNNAYFLDGDYLNDDTAKATAPTVVTGSRSSATLLTETTTAAPSLTGLSPPPQSSSLTSSVTVPNSTESHHSISSRVDQSPTVNPAGLPVIPNMLSVSESQNAPSSSSETALHKVEQQFEQVHLSSNVHHTRTDSSNDKQNNVQSSVSIATSSSAAQIATINSPTSSYGSESHHGLTGETEIYELRRGTSSQNELTQDINFEEARTYSASNTSKLPENTSIHFPGMQFSRYDNIYEMSGKVDEDMMAEVLQDDEQINASRRRIVMMSRMSSEDDDKDDIVITSPYSTKVNGCVIGEVVVA
jgi:hypothetical protein